MFIKFYPESESRILLSLSTFGATKLPKKDFERTNTNTPPQSKRLAHLPCNCPADHSLVFLLTLANSRFYVF